MNNIENKPEEKYKDKLFIQYDWFHEKYEPAIQKATDEFFSEQFTVKLVALSKNINILFQGEDYFVTKIRIDKQHDVFIRCSASAINIILDNVLGKNKKFDISKVTELESKIISSFNDYLYECTSKFLLTPPPKTEKRKNFDTVHLTMFIKEKNSEKAAKIIYSLPEILLSPTLVNSMNDNFDIMSFKNSFIDVRLKLGTTPFALKDIKSIEKGDIVIFEKSNITTMQLFYKNYEKVFKLHPNLGLVIPIDNDNGGNNMEDKEISQNLWDNIQVDMGAEFEKVRITLGELKNIEEGLVVDLNSVYNSKVSLTVENKTIAKGELVIVNDHYGVRIEQVYTAKPAPEAIAAEPTQSSPEQGQVPQEQAPEGTAPQTAQQTQAEGEEFDYSDFELEDEDI